MERVRTIVREAQGLGAIECGLLAGAIMATAIFATRLVGDDLAQFLFALSHGF